MTSTHFIHLRSPSDKQTNKKKTAMLYSCVSKNALRSVFDNAPSQCPTCCTPLLQGVIQLKEHEDMEERISFCVTCRKDSVVNNDGTLDYFFEKSKGSLYLQTNPFEDSIRWAPYLRDKIFPYVYLNNFIC